MPNSSAWASPSASRSAPTATTLAGYSASAVASSSARRLDPPPEIRTTIDSTRQSYRGALPPHQMSVLRSARPIGRAERRARSAGDECASQTPSRWRRRSRPRPWRTAATSHGFGPTSARRPGPVAPAENQASSPSSDTGDDADADGGAGAGGGPGTARRGRRPGAGGRRVAATEAGEDGHEQPEEAEGEVAGGQRAEDRAGRHRAEDRVRAARSRTPAPMREARPTSQRAAQTTRFGRKASCARVMTAATGDAELRALVQADHEAVVRRGRGAPSSTADTADDRRSRRRRRRGAQPRHGRGRAGRSVRRSAVLEASGETADPARPSPRESGAGRGHADDEAERVDEAGQQRAPARSTG